MPAQLLDGRAGALRIQTQVAEAVAERRRQNLPPLHLVVILVGTDPASVTYVTHKQRACTAVGIHSTLHHLPAAVSPHVLGDIIDRCNKNPAIHGILLQLPLPAPIQANDFLERIHPAKDVDGFHPYNLGRLAQGNPQLQPCTPLGIMKLLATTAESLTGKHAVVVGASTIVGRPMALALLRAQCTVTICHRFTRDLTSAVQAADILVAAIGQPGVIQSTWIKPGAIVIDVGFTRSPTGKMLGDIDFPTAQNRAAWITPVPGGVGPMTVAVLLENTLRAVALQEVPSLD